MNYFDRFAIKSTRNEPFPISTFRWCICSWKCLRPWKFFRMMHNRVMHHLVQFLVFKTYFFNWCAPKRRNGKWFNGKLIWWRTTNNCITWRNTSNLFYQDHQFDGYTIINDFLSLVNLYCINLCFLWPILSLYCTILYHLFTGIFT